MKPDAITKEPGKNNLAFLEGLSNEVNFLTDIFNSSLKHSSVASLNSTLTKKFHYYFGYMYTVNRKKN